MQICGSLVLHEYSHDMYHTAATHAGQLRTQDHVPLSGGHAVLVGQAGKTTVCTDPGAPHHPCHSPVRINSITQVCIS